MLDARENLNERGRSLMNCKFVINVAVILLLASLTSWAADDGAALYKKCAGCHGASGEGKPAMKAPALKGTTMEVTQIVERLTKGEAGSKPPHNKGTSGLTEGQAKTIAEYVKSL